MNDQGVKKDPKTITFRPSMRVREKIELALSTNKFEDKTDLLNQAINIGIESLKLCDWDTSAVAAKSTSRNINLLPPPANEGKRQASKS